MWRTERKEIDEFNALANRHHSSIKFTAEISDEAIYFLDTTVYKGERFHNQESLTSAHILNLQRLSNTRISLLVTLTGSEKVS